MERDTGYSMTDHTFEVCDNENAYNGTSSYLRCPVKNQPKNVNVSTIVAVLNPRVQDSDGLVSFLVPPSLQNKTVSVWKISDKSGRWVKAEHQAVKADFIQAKNVIDRRIVE